MSFYVFVGAPTGPDPRRAPPGPRAPQGPIPAGPHQGPGEGPGPRAQGPGEGPREGPPGPTRAQGPRTRAQEMAQQGPSITLNDVK